MVSGATYLGSNPSLPTIHLHIERDYEWRTIQNKLFILLLVNILIIPGFVGYPEEKTFEDLEKILTIKGHSVIKYAWPHLPNDLENYNLTETINYISTSLKHLNPKDTIMLGFSMGGIIACHLAKEFQPRKVGLIVTPYQAGSAEDLSGKYKEWKETGYRILPHSKYGSLRIPYSFIEDAQNYNALETISEIKCPILFIVGEKDDKIPTKVTMKLYNKANHPKEWHLISGMEHKYQYQPEILVKVNELIVNFIDI